MLQSEVFEVDDYTDYTSFSEVKACKAPISVDTIVYNCHKCPFSQKPSGTSGVVSAIRQKGSSPMTSATLSSMGISKVSTSWTSPRLGENCPRHGRTLGEQQKAVEIEAWQGRMISCLILPIFFGQCIYMCVIICYKIM
jgi:hypothetical protein